MQLPSVAESRLRTKKKKEIIYNSYKKTSDFGINKTYHILTYGCQMNVHDSEELAAILEDMGFSYESDYEKSNLVILNTCAIRENAHNKVFGLLGRLKHLKKTNPELMIGFCGCMSQEETVAMRLKNEYKWVNFVAGTHNIHNLASLIETAYLEKKQQIEVFSREGDVYENVPFKRDSRYKAWVNIMYGCDKFCTYCIVPYTRGAQRSRKIEDIVAEVKDLVEKGYLEVTLLGQNVNAYGKDFETQESFSTLLARVAETNIARVRFTTSHPWDFTDEMIEVIKKYSNIMPHIHLPVQSGSNEILKKMGRKYTKEEYLTIVSKLRNNIDSLALTTDIIVGFPNESDKDFEETLDIVKKCAYDSAFTFIYSPREGTPAALFKDNISDHEKKVRLQKLNIEVNNLALINNKKMLGKIYPVLLENINPKNNKMLSGYTNTMKLVNVETEEALLGKIVDVEITDAKTFSLTGKIVK